MLVVKCIVYLLFVNLWEKIYLIWFDLIPDSHIINFSMNFQAPHLFQISILPQIFQAPHLFQALHLFQAPLIFWSED